MHPQTDQYGNPLPRVRKIRAFGSEPVVAVAGTGLNTLIQIGLMSYLIFFELGLVMPSNGAVSTLVPLSLLGSAVGYASVVHWMLAARSRVELADYEAPPTWKVWAGWIIPFYNLVGPYRVMESLRVRVRTGPQWTMQVWWAGWLIFIVLDRVYSLIPDVNALTTSMLAISVVALAASYAALVNVILGVSASFQPAVSPAPVAPGITPA